jgi:hypothetical protein
MLKYKILIKIICSEFRVYMPCVWRHRSNGGGGVLSGRNNGLVCRNDHECMVMNHLKSIRNVSDRDALQYTSSLL